MKHTQYIYYMYYWKLTTENNMKEMIYTFFIPSNPFLLHPHPTHFYPIRLFLFLKFWCWLKYKFSLYCWNDKAFITEWTFLMCDDLIIHVSHLGYCLVIIWQIYSDILSLHSESDGEGLKRLTKFEWTEHYSKTFLVINSCSLFFLVWIRNLFFYEREEWNNFPFHDYVSIIITKIDNDNILILPFWPHIMLCLITFGSASCPCFR